MSFSLAGAVSKDYLVKLLTCCCLTF